MIQIMLFKMNVNIKFYFAKIQMLKNLIPIFCTLEENHHICTETIFK